MSFAVHPSFDESDKLLMKPASRASSSMHCPGPLPAMVFEKTGPPNPGPISGETGFLADSEQAAAIPSTITAATRSQFLNLVRTADRADVARTAFLHKLTQLLNTVDMCEPSKVEADLPAARRYRSSSAVRHFYVRSLTLRTDLAIG
jgi:hypothetical protein